MNFFESFLVAGVSMVFAMAFVWLGAWLFSPDLDSNTIWFIGAVVGYVNGTLEKVNCKLDAR